MSLVRIAGHLHEIQSKLVRSRLEQLGCFIRILILKTSIAQASQAAQISLRRMVMILVAQLSLAVPIVVLPYLFTSTEAIGHETNVCNVVENMEAISIVSNIAEKHLQDLGYPDALEDRKVVVLDCRDFFLLTQEYEDDLLGGISYVLVSKTGQVLFTHITG